MLLDLGQNLRAHLGQSITPEVAASLYASAVYIPPRQDIVLGPRVIEACDPRWFQQASEIFRTRFSAHSGHRIVAALDASGQPMALGILTRVQAGGRAELTAWVRGDHAGAGRHFLRALYAFAFNTLKVRVLLAIVASKNLASLRACRKMGFKATGYVPWWFGNTGAIVLSMVREDCNWFPKEN